MTAAHRHTFTALWWHLGKYGRQDVHLHSCFTPSCQTVLVAEGRTCSSDAEHTRHSLDAERWKQPGASLARRAAAHKGAAQMSTHDV